MENQPRQTLVEPEKLMVAPIQVDFDQRRMRGVAVVESELIMLKRSYSSMSQVFFGFTAGVAVSGILTLLTGQFDVRIAAIIGGSTFAAFVLAVMFLFQMRADRKSANEIVENILRRTQPLS